MIKNQTEHEAKLEIANACATTQLQLCEKYDVDLEWQTRTMMAFVLLVGQRHPELRSIIADEQAKMPENWRCFDRDHNVA